MVTHGAQQALDLVARVLVEPGDTVVLADPAYVGALQVLRAAGARLVAVPADGDGLDVDALADRLQAGLRPRLVYTVSELHNPTGATLAAERRRALAALAERYGFVVVDDDPYGELRWAGERPAPVRQLTDRVVTRARSRRCWRRACGSGTCVGPPALIRPTSCCSSRPPTCTPPRSNQRIVHGWWPIRGSSTPTSPGCGRCTRCGPAALAGALDACPR